MRFGYIPGELVGIFEDEQQAETAAELYGIELIRFRNNTALFKCTGDLGELIELGKRNRWPLLSLNMKYKAL